MRSRTTRFALAAGAVLGAVGVALGAYRAHGLEAALERLHEPAEVAKRLDWAQTAVLYQMLHALGLVAVAALAIRDPSRALRVTAWAFVVGVLLFSGGLHVQVLGAWKLPWPIVPAGGLALIVGWLALIVHALHGLRPTRPGP